MFVFLPQDRCDFVCTKCKLVSILEEKVQGLEQQVSTLRCIRETEDFLDGCQDRLLRAQGSEDSEQAAHRGQKDGEEIWQHVTSRRRRGNVHVPATQIQLASGCLGSQMGPAVLPRIEEDENTLQLELGS
ncbi:unnamed protein product [Caretta caretta]